MNKPMTQKSHSDLREMRQRSRVTAKEVAAELKCDAGVVARFEKYGAPLSYGLTGEDYEKALNKLIKAGADK